MAGLEFGEHPFDTFGLCIGQVVLLGYGPLHVLRHAPFHFATGTMWPRAIIDCLPLTTCKLPRRVTHFPIG
jgi:hypothetical protein